MPKMQAQLNETDYFLPLINSLFKIEAQPKDSVSFIPDKILRSLGLKLIDGRAAGIAVILGPAKDETAAVNLIKDFQSKGIVSFLAGNICGNTMQKQLRGKGVKMGPEHYIIPLGSDYLSAIYAIDFMIRLSFIYGGFKPGEWQNATDYIRDRIPAFILLLGHTDEVAKAIGSGALAFGMPVITDIGKDYEKLASRCILARGIKIRLAEINLPIPYSSAFEGERVNGERLQVELGGESSPSFEFLTLKGENEVEDGKIEIIGPDIDQLNAEVGGSLPLAIIVDLYGRKMQKDLEPILERQIHRFVNYAKGLMHTGQREGNCIRVSREAFLSGFRLKDIGVILHTMLHHEYGSIVDKVQVRLFTKNEDVKKLLITAKKVFDQRDERLNGMTDESVDTYYSCLICQSFTPNHVCIITPERSGLCGAYSWLDAKASFEITPTGPNQPILKGKALDRRLGQWESVNEYVRNKSNKTIEKVSLYSLMDSPQSSCGYVECIVAIIPEVNGVMVVHRNYSGLTPSGMNFTALAGLVERGTQTPGFLGVSRLYILSDKFISAEGGLKRLVWMPKELKGLLGGRLRKAARDIGEPDLLEQIADEEVATTLDELSSFIKKVKHPVISMESLM